MINPAGSRPGASSNPVPSHLTSVEKVVAVLAFLSLVAPLLVYTYIGFFTRYMADDYTIAVNLKNHGFWAAQSYWYQVWSGRYTFTFITSLVGLAGVKIVPFLPVTALLLWAVGLYGTLGLFLKKVGIHFPAVIRLGLMAVILMATLRSQPFIFQVLFWQTGILTYVLPLICFIFTFGWFLWRFRPERLDRFHIIEILGLALWAFILGGISETSLFLQIGMLGMGTIYFLLRSSSHARRSVLVCLAAALVGSFVALWLVASSPGNMVRSPGFPPQMGVLQLAAGSLRTTTAFFIQWFTQYLRMVACAFGFPAVLVFGLASSAERLVSSRRILFSLMWISLMLFLVTWFSFAPAYYILQAWPPDRALILVQFLVITWAVYVGTCFAWLVRRVLAPVLPRWIFRSASLGVLLVLIVIGPLHAATNLVTMVPKAREYAAAWDARDLYIRTQRSKGELNLEVKQIRDLSKLGDLFPEADFWINRLVAEYYGLDSIVAIEDSPAEP